MTPHLSPHEATYAVRTHDKVTGVYFSPSAGSNTSTNDTGAVFLFDRGHRMAGPDLALIWQRIIEDLQQFLSLCKRNGVSEPCSGSSVHTHTIVLFIRSLD